MAVKTYLADSGKYLVCRVDEPITFEVIQEMTSRMNKLAEETGVHRRLIDARGTSNMMSVMANYDLAYKYLDAMQLDRSTKIAALRMPRNEEGFASIAIRNAGFNLKVFVDETEAITWLEE